MLEARRNEKNFQQRRNETYAKAHADLVVKIDGDFGRLEALTKASGLGALFERSSSRMAASRNMRRTSSIWWPRKSNWA